MKKIAIILILLVLITGSLFSESNILYFNNITRPMGMGGAYTAVQDSLLSHFYNPAAVDFSQEGKNDFSVSFDLIRMINVLITIADTSDIDWDNEDEVSGVLLASLALSTANLAWTSDTWFFKVNILDQLITQGPDFPMYSTSITLAYKFKGALRGFQTGFTGHLYNIGSPSLPQGYSTTWGLFYRSPNSSFSLGLFYFHASDDMPYIRKPFEQIFNNAFNVGIAYELYQHLTLSFDLRNISNFNQEAYFQPHFGIEKTIIFKGSEKEYLSIDLRAGTYYDSETKEVGYSWGVDLRYNFAKSNLRNMYRESNNSGYIYLSYSLTKEEKVVSLYKTLDQNHIISIGITFK